MAYVKIKIGKRLGLLKRTKKFLSLKARTLFYNSIIQPTLDYGAVVWEFNNKRHLQDIVKLQKRCARITLDKKWDTSSRPLFKELNILSFDKGPDYLWNILVFKALNNLAPNYIRAMFTMSSRTLIMWAREAQSTVWYYQRLGLEWPKMAMPTGFDQLGAWANSQKTLKGPSRSVHFRWNLKLSFYDHNSCIYCL